MPEANMDVLRIAARQLVRDQQWELAQQIAESMDSEHARSYIYRELARQRAIAGELEQAKQAFAHTVGESDQVNALLMIAGQAATAGDVATVEWAIDHMAVDQRPTWGWPSRVAALIHADRLDEARAMIQEKNGDERETDRLSRAFISALIDTGRLDEAETLLADQTPEQQTPWLLRLAEAHLKRDEVATAGRLTDAAHAVIAQKRAEGHAPHQWEHHLRQVAQLALRLGDLDRFNTTMREAQGHGPHLEAMLRGTGAVIVGEGRVSWLGEQLAEVQQPAVRAMLCLEVAEALIPRPPV